MAAIPKFAAEDTSLVTGNMHGEKTTVPVPKGTELIIDTPGIHYNRRLSIPFFFYLKQITFRWQLVTGKTHMHLTLRVSSPQIGLVMLLCPLVLVRN